MSPKPTAALFLVRHAEAGDRAGYLGDDLGRPLTSEGLQQSEEIAKRLAALPPTLLLSSPARRCVETLEPLAAVSSKAVEIRDELAEGADPKRALASLLAADPSPAAAVVACSHGDVLTGIVEDLLARGVSTSGKVKLPKGVTVEVAIDRAGEPTHLRFVRV